MPILQILILQCKGLNSMKIPLNFFVKKWKRMRAKIYEKHLFLYGKERNKYGNMMW